MNVSVIVGLGMGASVEVAVEVWIGGTTVGVVIVGWHATSRTQINNRIFFKCLSQSFEQIRFYFSAAIDQTKCAIKSSSTKDFIQFSQGPFRNWTITRQLRFMAVDSLLHRNHIFMIIHPRRDFPIRPGCVVAGHTIDVHANAAEGFVGCIYNILRINHVIEL